MSNWTDPNVDFFGIEDYMAMNGIDEDVVAAILDYENHPENYETEEESNMTACTDINDDVIYHEFFMMNEHFTIEDYDDHFAVYHEGMFVAELQDKDDTASAHKAALNYMFACRR